VTKQVNAHVVGARSASRLKGQESLDAFRSIIREVGLNELGVSTERALLFVG